MGRMLPDRRGWVADRLLLMSLTWMEDIFEILRSRSGEQGFTRIDGDDVDRWAVKLNLGVSAFFNRTAAEIARRYHAGVASFEFCDSLVNDLSGVLFERVGKENEITPFPDLFYVVYDAFDAGEFHRAPDKSDNPRADFTDPLIAEIVGKLG